MFLRRRLNRRHLVFEIQNRKKSNPNKRPRFTNLISIRVIQNCISVVSMETPILLVGLLYFNFAALKAHHSGPGPIKKISSLNLLYTNI